MDERNELFAEFSLVLTYALDRDFPDSVMVSLIFLTTKVNIDDGSVYLRCTYFHICQILLT